MAKKAQINLQDNFLNMVRKDNIPVTIYACKWISIKRSCKGI